MPHISEQISPEVKYERKAIHPGAYLYWNEPSSGQFHQWNNLLYVKAIRFGVFWPEAAAAELELPGAGSCRCGYPLLLQGTSQVNPGEDSAILQEVTHTTTLQVDTSSAAEAPAMAPHQCRAKPAQALWQIHPTTLLQALHGCQGKVLKISVGHKH